MFLSGFPRCQGFLAAGALFNSSSIVRVLLNDKTPCYLMDNDYDNVVPKHYSYVYLHQNM